MNRVHLEEINEGNFDQVLALRVHPNQEKFIAPNAKSLAQCYLYRNDGVYPFAVCCEQKVVGFALMDVDDDDDDVFIWKLMIDRDYQNRGYGKEAVTLLIEWTSANTKYDELHLLCDHDNAVGRKLYESCGFLFKKTIHGTEDVMSLKLIK